MGNPRGRSIGGMQSRTSTARKPAARPEPPVAAQVIELAPRVDDDEAGASALDSVLSELGAVDQGRILVYRVSRQGGQLEYVATLTADEAQGEASLCEAIRRDYGGGTYRVHVRDGAGLIANRRIDIAERRTPAAPDAGLAAVLTATLDRFQLQLTQALQVQRPQVSEADAEERALARIKTMAEILGPRSGGVDTGTVMETLTHGIELGKQLGGAGGGDNTGAVMLESLRAFTTMLAQQPVRRPVPARQAPAPAAALPAATAPAAPQQPDQVTAMRTLLQVLLAGAQRDGDPELYAALVLDQLGDEAVAELLQQPDPVALLLQFEPAAAPHRDWLQAVAGELKDDADGDDGQGAKHPDGHPGRPGRGDSHAGPDAGPGA
jgi:hypothetical protein